MIRDHEIRTNSIFSKEASYCSRDQDDPSGFAG